jgi:hypothetical protein
MTNQSEDAKWEFVEKHLVKKEQQLPQVKANPMTAPLTGDVPEPQGVIERFKVNKIERNQRIQVLTERTKGQLEVWKHYVEGQVGVAKQQIDAHVEARLMEIGRQHLLSLQEIGISNFEDRQRALQDLSQRSAEQLQRVNAMDVPPGMKQKLLDAVTKGWEQLFDKIQSEEIRTTRAD